jgi:hypothetical protein
MIKRMVLGLMLASSGIGFTFRMGWPCWVWTYGPFVLGFSLLVYAAARYRRKKRFARYRREAIYWRSYFQEQYGPQLDTRTTRASSATCSSE